MIIIKTRIYPTEDPDLVLKALKALFPRVEFSLVNDEFIGRGDLDDLDIFRERIRDRRIRDTVEFILESHWDSGKTWINLNKQDATKGIVNVSESSPLGSIRLEIKIPRERIHWLVWENGD